jgi:hypothetical protein
MFSARSSCGRRRPTSPPGVLWRTKLRLRSRFGARSNGLKGLDLGPVRAVDRRLISTESAKHDTYEPIEASERKGMGVGRYPGRGARRCHSAAPSALWKARFALMSFESILAGYFGRFASDWRAHASTLRLNGAMKLTERARHVQTFGTAAEAFRFALKKWLVVPSGIECT